MKISQKIEELSWYKKLQVLRAISGMTQGQAAEKCRVDRRIYWNWENGIYAPIQKNREVIANVYNVSKEEIFTDLNEEE